MRGLEPSQRLGRDRRRPTVHRRPKSNPLSPGTGGSNPVPSGGDSSKPSVPRRRSPRRSFSGAPLKPRVARRHRGSGPDARARSRGRGPSRLAGRCFPCGDRRLYWFLTRNAAPGSHAGPLGNRGEAIECIRDWRVPFRCFVEATEEEAILRNDVVDRPARRVWGAGPVTLLGDSIHATTPNLGQAACQALEDAVVLADSLRRCAPAEAALRDYEVRRHHRAKFVIGQSLRIGTMVQLINPMGVWLRAEPRAASGGAADTLFDCQLRCAPGAMRSGARSPRAQETVLRSQTCSS